MSNFLEDPLRSVNDYRAIRDGNSEQDRAQRNQQLMQARGMGMVQNSRINNDPTPVLNPQEGSQQQMPALMQLLMQMMGGQT